MKAVLLALANKGQRKAPSFELGEGDVARMSGQMRGGGIERERMKRQSDVRTEREGGAETGSERILQLVFSVRDVCSRIKLEHSSN